MKRAVLAGLFGIGLCGCSVIGEPDEIILRVAADTSSAPIVAAALNEYEAATPGVYFAAVPGGADTALTALQAGEVDFALLFLPADANAPFQVSVGTEALVFIVHPDNPVEMLTTTQVRAIFSGRTVNWEAVGGSDSSIHVVAREDGSDARRVFQALVLGDQQHASTAQIATSSEQAIGIVGDDPQAIGYITLGSLDERVRALGLNGVLPSPQTVRDGEYTLVGQIMFVAQAEPEGAAGEFLSWLLARDD
jgi:phosphate transport system substrate-binding protein